MRKATALNSGGACEEASATIAINVLHIRIGMNRIDGFQGYSIDSLHSYWSNDVEHVNSIAISTITLVPTSAELLLHATQTSDKGLPSGSLGASPAPDLGAPYHA